MKINSETYTSDAEEPSFWKDFPTSLQHQVLAAERNEMYLDLLPKDVLNQVVVPLAGTIACQTCRCPLQFGIPNKKPYVFTTKNDAPDNDDSDSENSKKSQDNQSCNLTTNDNPEIVNKKDDVEVPSSLLSRITSYFANNSTTQNISRACYVKSKLKGTSMEDTVKHKVCVVKTIDHLLKLDHVYCRGCAQEYCWDADLDNHILQKTKSFERQEREKQEELEQGLKFEQKQGRRNSSSTPRKGKSNSNNNKRQR